MGLVTISDILRNNTTRRPDHPAYIYSSHTQTWRELNVRVDAVAAGLWKLGVRPGDVICTLCKDGPVLVEILYAAARIGAVRVGLNYRFSGTEIGTLVRHSGAKLIIAQNDLRTLVEDVDPAFGIIDCGDGQGRLGDYEGLLRPDLSPPNVPVSDDDLAQICYTTGSTGEPKGAMWTHAAYLHVLSMVSIDLDLKPNDIFLHCLPGSGVPCVLATWNAIVGFTNVIMPAFDPDLALDLIEHHNVTFTLWVPTMITAVCDAFGRKQRNVSTMHAILYGSAPTPPALVRRALKIFNSAELIQVYGSTEGIGGWFTKLSAAEHRHALANNEKLLESCGRPMIHARVEVVNERNEPVEAGEVGEVRVTGGFLMTGYYKAAEITRNTIRQGWLYTGDMGRLDDEGYLYLVDRKQFMIITGGYNVYPIEIENVIAEHPGVQEVCVFGVPHDKWGEAIHVALVPRAKASLSEAEITTWCRERLSSFKVPKSIEIRDALIRGATGKILKRAERERFISAD